MKQVDHTQKRVRVFEVLIRVWKFESDFGKPSPTLARNGVKVTCTPTQMIVWSVDKTSKYPMTLSSRKLVKLALAYK